MTRSAAASIAAPASGSAPGEGTSPTAIKPIVDTTTAAPATPPVAAAEPAAGIDNELAMELGGGALALIALGGGAYALARRRRRRDELMYDEADEADTAEAHDPLFDEPMFHHEPAIAEEQPAIVAPAASAFAWGNAQPCDNPSDDGSDRCPGESWVERAHRGPSPANPSVSLKTRLSRAAFFDKRERDVAAGTAEPVDPDAGLPDAMVEEQERELV